MDSFRFGFIRLKVGLPIPHGLDYFNLGVLAESVDPFPSAFLWKNSDYDYDGVLLSSCSNYSYNLSSVLAQTLYLSGNFDDSLLLYWSV